MTHRPVTSTAGGNRPTFRERLAQKGLPILFVFPAAFLFLFVFILPMFVALRYSMLSTMPFWDPNPTVTFANYVRVFVEPIYLRAFLRTAIYAAGSTAISLVISYPVAYYLARISRRGSLFLLILLIPFWTSTILRVFSWKVILGGTGMLNSLLLSIGLLQEPVRFLYNPIGVIFGLVYTYTPYMVLPLYATLGKVPRELQEASDNLGANKLQTLLKITIPLTSSGTMSAVILVLLACFGDVLSSDLLGGPNTLMISRTIFEAFYAGANWNVGSALSVVVFVALLAMAALISWLGKEKQYA